MVSVAFSPFPITRLTIRQFARGKSLLVAAGIVFFPVLFAILGLLAPDGLTVRQLRQLLSSVIFLGAFTGTLLPVATLLLASGAFGDELDDRTLSYLTLKPISRLRIVIEKLLGVLIVGILLAWTGILATVGVAAWGRYDAVEDLVWPMLLSTAAGVIGFGSFFLLLSLYIPRALLTGLFYTFVWESALARFLPGIRTISIRHYAQSIFAELADDRRIVLAQQAELRTSVITVVAICVLSIALGTWRLRRMNLE
ncbi:MAG: ABC transporter permease subunit [Chloroflexia bacterium]|nr:ABC transporter permease subunit [Chloroflexia bacterium]